MNNNNNLSTEILEHFFESIELENIRSILLTPSFENVDSKSLNVYPIILNSLTSFKHVQLKILKHINFIQNYQGFLEWDIEIIYPFTISSELIIENKHILNFLTTIHH